MALEAKSRKATASTVTASRSPLRADIQGLRAVAVAMVVFFHAGLPLPGGYLGVDVFFVISGYVICAMLHREWQANGRIRFGRFYWRRFKRLTPALALMVSITLGASALLLSPLGPQEVAAQTGIGAMLLIANVVISQTTGGYFDAPAELNPLLNTWSLSVEEQFYLVFPAAIALGWWISKRSGIRGLVAVLVTVIAVGSFALAVREPNPTDDPLVSHFYNPLPRAWEFAVGALLALIVAASKSKSMGRAAHTALSLAGFAGLGLVGLAALRIGDSTQVPGWSTLVPVAGTLLAIAAGSWSTRGPVPRLLSFRPFSRVGDWSYSIYLWHWPFIVLAASMWPRTSLVLVLAAFASVPVALLSYYLVEQPIRLKSGLTRGKSVTLFLVVLMTPLAVAVGLWIASANAFWQDSIREIRVSSVEFPFSYQQGCASRSSPDDRLERCWFNKEADGRPVYLAGDSKAGQLDEGGLGAAEALGRPISIYTPDACPYLDLYRSQIRNPASRIYDEQCRAVYEMRRNWLLEATPGTVVISNTFRYLNGATPIGPDPQNLVTSISEKEPIYQDALRKSIEELQEAGHEVLIAEPGPRFPGWNPKTCSTIAVLNGSCISSISLDSLREKDAVLGLAHDNVASDTGAALLDYRPPLCPEGICVTGLPNGVWLSRDGDHISVRGSQELVPLFTETLRGY